MKRQRNFTRAIIICHGKSEIQICQYIRQSLRLPIEIDSNDNGNSSVQIEGLDDFFNRRHYKSARALYNKYSGIKEPIKGKITQTDFRIFTWMDIDGCRAPMSENYKCGKMFQERWFYEHLHPIYCDPKLEKILTRAGLPFTSKNDKEKKQEYIKLFPTDPKYKTPNRLNDREQIEDLYKRLQKVKNQNLQDLIGFCLQLDIEQKQEGQRFY